jgi:alkanesulfonate monooxygenase SsuD/methylene tetrahydromethanopterin reductase-like flavin-dependent oxidoreductase (luciferase family)
MILAIATVCAESEERADYLATSMDLAWVRLQRSELGPLPSPKEAAAYPYTPQERAIVRSYRSLNFVGTPTSVREQLLARVAETGADEVMVISTIHSHAERLRSYELLAEAFNLPAHSAGARAEEAVIPEPRPAMLG